MRNFSEKRKLLYALSEWIYIGSTALAAFIGWINSLKESERWIKNRPILWSAIEYIQDHSMYLYLFIGLLVLFSFLHRKLGDPWALEKLQFIIDEYQGKVFSANGAPKDHDRVTIFQHKKNYIFARHWSATRWYMPWGNKPIFSNYLVPILRSGHLSKNSKAIFYAPDGSDKAEGVAAMAWAKRGSVVLSELPEILAVTGKRDREKYAKVTKCDIGLLDKYILEGRQPPRSIAAIPIECRGRIWGVVVLDSRSPRGVTNESVDNYTLTVALIGHLLERA